jgi:hypothetical protein
LGSSVSPVFWQALKCFSSPLRLAFRHARVDVTATDPLLAHSGVESTVIHESVVEWTADRP